MNISNAKIKDQSKVKTKQVMVNAPLVNVRYFPDMRDTSKKRVAYSGDTFPVVRTVGEFIEIMDDGKRAFIKSEFLDAID